MKQMVCLYYLFEGWSDSKKSRKTKMKTTQCFHRKRKCRQKNENIDMKASSIIDLSNYDKN
jgi:hypothetical protein